MRAAQRVTTAVLLLVVLAAAQHDAVAIRERSSRTSASWQRAPASRRLREEPSAAPPAATPPRGSLGPPITPAGADQQRGLPTAAVAGVVRPTPPPQVPEMALQVSANPANPGVALRLGPSSSSSSQAPPQPVVHKLDTSVTSASAAVVPHTTDGASSSPAMISRTSISGSATYSSGAGGYWYVPTNTASNVPLGMPVTETPGLRMPRWVMCAWSVSNFSSPLMLSEDVMHEVQAMINNFTSMAPGQVQLAAHANVTLALQLSDIPPETAVDEPLLTRVLQAAASEWAGGYDGAYIDVSFAQPDYGVPTGEFQAAVQQPVVRKSLDALVLPHSGNSSSGTNNSSTTTSPSSSSSSSSGGNRRMLRQHQSRSGARGVRHVWVSYTRMTPLNATELQQRIAASCGVDQLTGGLALDGTLCAEVLSQLFRASGVALGRGGVGLQTTDAPVVSLAIRLAIGVTESQAAAGTDNLLAAWLAQPRNIRSAIAISGVPDPIGPGAIIKWLLPPEIWISPPPAASHSNPLSNPANAVGVALGAAAFVFLLVALTAWLCLKHRRAHRAELEADKHDTASIASSRRRRRRHGKRRYLLPEAPAAPDPEAATSSAAAMRSAGSSISGSEGEEAAAGGAGVSSDDVMTPDQIRPAMRELGDSVTSAARFEDDDEEEQEGAAASSSSSSNRSSSSGGGNNAQQGGSEPAAAATAAVGSPGRSLTPAQRVLAAREALLAEQRGSARAAAGSSSGPGCVELASLGGAAATGAAAAAAAAGSAAHRKMHSPFGSAQAQRQQQQQQEPELQGAAAADSPRGLQQQQQQQEPQHSHQPPSAAILAQGQPFRASTKSPFAASYNFGDLADAAAAAAAPSPAAAAAAAAADCSAAGSAAGPLSNNSSSSCSKGPVSPTESGHPHRLEDWASTCSSGALRRASSGSSRPCSSEGGNSPTVPQGPTPGLRKVVVLAGSKEQQQQPQRCDVTTPTAGV